MINSFNDRFLLFRNWIIERFQKRRQPNDIAVNNEACAYISENAALDVSLWRQPMSSSYDARNVFPSSLSQSRFLKNGLETCSRASGRSRNFRNHEERTFDYLPLGFKISHEQLPTCWHHCRLIARILPRMCIVYIYSWVPLDECKQNFSANMKWHGRFLRLRLVILRCDYVFAVCVPRGITRVSIEYFGARYGDQRIYPAGRTSLRSAVPSC